MNEPEPRFDPGLTRMVAALLRFLESKDRDRGRAFIRGVVLHKLYGKKRKGIDTDLVDELTQMAWLRALEARMPPWTEWGIPGWVARVTKRTIADSFRMREADEKELEPGVDVGELPGDRHGPHTDWGAREHLIAKYVEELIGDDAGKKHTFRLMMEKEVVGRSVQELAVQEGTTPNALSLRFTKLRKELYPDVATMDEEKPRRTVILTVLLFSGLGVLVAIAAVLWSLLAPAQLRPEPPPPPPTATTAPSPSLDIAQPPTPQAEDGGDIEIAPKKPQLQRPQAPLRR
jgi:hypothetical protein